MAGSGEGSADEGGPLLAVDLPVQGVPPAEGIELARRFADRGYGACWTSEVQGPDAFTQLGALAVTTDLQLGVAVVPVQTRTPMVLGMTAVTLAQMSGGRFTLGLGASSEVIVTKWAGQPFDAPLTHVRETVEAIRPMLRGERASHQGRFVDFQTYKPASPPPDPVPLFLGSLNPKSLRQAGELADGVCLNQVAPQHVQQLLDHVREGAAEAGREIEFGNGPGQYGVMARLFCAVTDDVEAARPVVKSVFAPYIATSVYNRFYRSLGYEDEARTIAEAAERGDREAIVEGMSDELVDDIFVLGPAEEVADRVNAYVEAGITIPSIAVMGYGIEDAERTLAAVADGWEG